MAASWQKYPTVFTIMTASTAGSERLRDSGRRSRGVYELFVDALNGSAANLVGDITPGSVYAHIDQSLGPWAQRPVFKTNVKTFVSLRKAERRRFRSPISRLSRRTSRMPISGFDWTLAIEPERFEQQRQDPAIPPPDPNNTAIFAVLQQYVKVNLVRPVGAPHMWHAAMQSKSCESDGSKASIGENWLQMGSCSKKVPWNTNTYKNCWVV